jgi:hypothetical protein
VVTDHITHRTPKDRKYKQALEISTRDPRKIGEKAIKSLVTTDEHTPTPAILLATGEQATWGEEDVERRREVA